MISMTVVPDLDEGGFPEGIDEDNTAEGQIACITGVAKGMQSGKPAVGIIIHHEGTNYVAFTSLALFLSAADALKAKHGDPREDA